MINLAKLGTTKACKILWTFNKGTDNIDINAYTANFRADEPVGGK
jgi:hypothetical protein